MAQELTTARQPPKPPRHTHSHLQNQTELQDAIHEPHQKQRDRLIDALAEATVEDLKRQARRMAGCAASVHLYIDDDAEQVHEYVHRCKSRLCPFCARARSAHVADQMQAIVDRMQTPKTLVLTVKSTNTPLVEQLANLRNWFTKFRRTPFWSQNVASGVYTVEVTINEKTGLWHPHLHIIFDGPYMPWKVIQRLWHEITDGSEIVHITQVYNRQGAVNELTKYIGKPQDADTWTDAQLREYAAATKGARMIQTFGRRKPAPIIDTTPDDAPAPKTWSVSVTRLVWMFGQGDLTAAAILPLVADRWPHLARYIYQKAPQLESQDSRDQRTAAELAAIQAGRPVRRLAKAPPADPRALEISMIPLLQRLRAETRAREGTAKHLAKDHI